MAWYNADFSAKADEVGWAFYALASKCYQWSDATRDNIIGRVLIFPFTEYIGDRCETAAFAFWLIRDRARELWRFIQDTASGGLIDLVLGSFVRDWYTLKSDPKRWVVMRVSDAWPDFYWFAQDPIYMIEYWLTPWLSQIRLLRERGSAWVWTMLREVWPDAAWLRDAPYTTITRWLVTNYPFLSSFLWDPDGWVKTRIGWAFGVSGAFWSDPMGSIVEAVFDKIEDAGVSVRERVFQLGRFILVELFRGVW